MLNWKFDVQDYLNGGAKPIEPGNYRVKIDAAEETYTKNGAKQMIKLKLKVNERSGFVWHYIVLDFDNKERTNKNLGDVFNSFGISAGDLDLGHWVGKIGAAVIKQEDYQGKKLNRIDEFISIDKQGILPPWKEKESAANIPAAMSPQMQTPNNIDANMMNFDDVNPNNVPF